MRDCFKAICNKLTWKYLSGYKELPPGHLRKIEGGLRYQEETINLIKDIMQREWDNDKIEKKGFMISHGLSQLCL